MGVLDKLNAAGAPTGYVKIPLRGDLQAEWDELMSKVQDVALKDTSLAADGITAHVQKMEALRDEIAASEVAFEFRALPWRKRVALQAEHPPRDGVFIDKVRGYNVITFSPALIMASCTAVIDEEGDRLEDIPAETWLHLLGDDDKPGALNMQAVNELVKGANVVNDEVPSVPPSALSWLVTPVSGESSTPSKTGPDPAPSVSTDGSPSGSSTSFENLMSETSGEGSSLAEPSSS